MIAVIIDQRFFFCYVHLDKADFLKVKTVSLHFPSEIRSS